MTTYNFDKIELVDMEGGGVYWLMDSERCGWLCSETYPNYEDAVIAMKNQKVIWEK